MALQLLCPDEISINTAYAHLLVSLPEIRIATDLGSFYDIAQHFHLLAQSVAVLVVATKLYIRIGRHRYSYVLTVECWTKRSDACGGACQVAGLARTPLRIQHRRNILPRSPTIAYSPVLNEVTPQHG
jgi:hypothetical protein